MLISVALILIAGMVVEAIMKRLKLPALIGYLLAGIILGPFVLNMVDESFLSLSPVIRQIALVIILTRAGLSLDLSALVKVGRPALMMCFVPATIEIIASVIFGPMLLGLNLVQSLILGAILAAVSPAVVVPRMVQLIKEGRGVDKQIPQIVLAGSSADDVYVLVLFSAFLVMGQGKGFEVARLAQIPVSILAGILAGYLAGKVLSKFINNWITYPAFKIGAVLAASFVLIQLETVFQGYLSGMLAVIVMNMTVRKDNLQMAEWLSTNYNHMWQLAEIFLFFLVGAGINPSYTLNEGWMPVVFVLVLSLCRVLIGVNLSVCRAGFTNKERLYLMISYLPKATVQAAIGSVPMQMGIAGGELMFTVSALSILITAPLGAILMDYAGPRLLKKQEEV